MDRIYLDYQATTPLDPAVLEAMLPYFTNLFGNPASRGHAFGWEASEAVDLAREAVAGVVAATAREIVWTSGATESINLAIKGVAESYRDKGRHLITSQAEHKATLDSCRYLETQGYEVSYLPVDRYGRVDPVAVEAAIRPETLLISLIHGNNEVGTLNPVAAVGRIAKARGVLYHVDAAQTFGKLALDVNELGADLLSISAHKVYGPKGVGALYVRGRSPRVKLAPQMHGGGHERGMRSGSLNVPGIVGLGKSAELASSLMPQEATRTIALRERLYRALTGALDEVHLNGHPTERLPGNLNLAFGFVESEAMIIGLKGIAVSSGSACTSASLEPSHVLKACAVEDDLAHASVRFGLGRFTTEAEIDEVARVTIDCVNRLRERSPLYELYKDGVDVLALRRNPR